MVNIHGPFSKPERKAFDTWLDSVPNIGILLSDFSNHIWLEACAKRWWHHKLLEGSLLDPGMSLAPTSANAHASVSTKKKKEQLDAILLLQTHWHCTPQISQYTILPLSR